MNRPKRILAVASGGGHWEQLMLIREAFDGHNVRFATTIAGLGDHAGLPSTIVITDCNRNGLARIARCTVDLLVTMIRVRPQIVVSTGALPGLLALALGRKLGKRTIWIDSVANVEEMSLAGKSAKRHADLWLSQWPLVAAREGADYAGSIL